MSRVPAAIPSQPDVAWVPLGSVPFRLDGLLRTALDLANRPHSEDPALTAVLLHGVLDWVGRLNHPDIRAMLDLTPDDTELLDALLGARDLAERRVGLPLSWECRPLAQPTTNLDHGSSPLVDRGEGLLEWWWARAEDGSPRSDHLSAYQRRLAGQCVRLGIDALIIAAYRWRWGRSDDLDWDTRELDPRLDYDAGEPAATSA